MDWYRGPTLPDGSLGIATAVIPEEIEFSLPRALALLDKSRWQLGYTSPFGDEASEG